MLAAVMIPVFLLSSPRSSSTSATGSRTTASSRTAQTPLRSRPAWSWRSNWPACITDATAENCVTAAAKRYARRPRAIRRRRSTPRSPIRIQAQRPGQLDVEYARARTTRDGAARPVPATLRPARPRERVQRHAARGYVGGREGAGADTQVVRWAVRDRPRFRTARAHGWSCSRRSRRTTSFRSRSPSSRSRRPESASSTSARRRDRELGAEAARRRESDAALASSYGVPIRSGTATTVPPGTMSIATPTHCPGPGDATCAGDGQLTTRRSASSSGSPAGRTSTSRTSSRARHQLAREQTSADCYSAISRIRVYQNTGGLFGDRPQIRDVTLSPSGARPCVMDVYYSRTTSRPRTARSTRVSSWTGARGRRPGRDLHGEHLCRRQPVGRDGRPGATGHLDGRGCDQRPGGPGSRPCLLAIRAAKRQLGALTDDARTARQQPCVQTGTTAVHAANLGDDPSGGDPPSEIVGSVKLTDGPLLTSSERHSAQTNTTIAPYVTIGLRTVFKTGDWSVLRLNSGQRNFSIICDPYWPQPSTGDTTAAFHFGCQPPYARNDTTVNSFWWNTTTKSCPPDSAYLNLPSGTWPNQRIRELAVAMRPARPRRQRSGDGRRDRARHRELHSVEGRRDPQPRRVHRPVPVPLVHVLQRRDVLRQRRSAVSRTTLGS